jgi:serine/threonine-protein kinase
MSPEVARGEPAGKTGDVYSAAAVLFLLLTGQPPFPAPDAATVMRRHIEEPAPALSGHGPELAALVARCLSKDPSDRPPDAAAMLAELEDAARRRYGAAWLSRSGLAALVLATVDLGLGTGGSGAVA